MSSILTKSNEDYLECILLLGGKEKGVKSIEVAKMMGVSKPAVNKAMNDLKASGLIEKESYSDIMLTQKGRTAAKQVYEKHMLFKDFLIKIGVSEQTAEKDSCKIEHILSDESIEKIKLLSDSLNNKSK